MERFVLWSAQVLPPSVVLQTPPSLPTISRLPVHAIACCQLLMPFVGFEAVLLTSVHEVPLYFQRAMPPANRTLALVGSTISSWAYQQVSSAEPMAGSQPQYPWTPVPSSVAKVGIWVHVGAGAQALSVRQRPRSPPSTPTPFMAS